MPSCKLFPVFLKSGKEPDFKSPPDGALLLDEPGSYRAALWQHKDKKGRAYFHLQIEKHDPSPYKPLEPEARGAFWAGLQEHLGAEKEEDAKDKERDWPNVG